MTESNDRMELREAGARLADAQATGTIVNADAGPREWMARFGRIDLWRVADTIDGRLEVGRPYATTGEMSRESTGSQEMPPAHATPAAEPALEDAERILVGMWRSRFGAMPVPRVPPTPDPDAGARRTRASSGARVL